MRLAFRSLILLLVVNASMSCEYLPNKDVDATDYDTFGLRLVKAIDSGVFIDNVSRHNNRDVEIGFSDGQDLIISASDLMVITIGINGQWSINGVQSTFSTEDHTIEDIVSNPIADTGALYALSEGYEDWTFHFWGYPYITIRKSIYSKNYDGEIISINHRGYNTLAPENTIPAFRLSRLMGFRYVETDVQFTADNIPVLLHDDSIDRTSNGTGRIKDLSFSQVRNYDFGSWKSIEYLGIQIPSLEEFLLFCKKAGLKPVLELKVGTIDQIGMIVDIVDNLGLADDTTYMSFSSTILSRVLKKEPGSTVALLTSNIDDKTFDIINSLNALKTPIINSSDYRAETVEECRKLNIPIWVWVVNSEEIVKIMPSYVSAVTSDILHAGRIKNKIN